MILQLIAGFACWNIPKTKYGEDTIRKSFWKRIRVRGTVK